MLFVNNSDTRGTSGGREERGLLKKAWRKLYNRESFTGTLTKAVTNKKFRPPFQWAAHKGGAFMHEFGAYAPNITGCGATLRERRFFSLTFEQRSALFA